MSQPIEDLAREALEDDKKASPSPWKWSVCMDSPQLEDSTEYAELNPVMLARGCGGDKATTAGVKGCMPNQLGDDPMRACPLHPTKEDRDFIANSRAREPALAREVMRLRSWMNWMAGRAFADGCIEIYEEHIEAALRGDAPPAPAADPDAENMHD